MKFFVFALFLVACRGAVIPAADTSSLHRPVNIADAAVALPAESEYEAIAWPSLIPGGIVNRPADIENSIVALPAETESEAIAWSSIIPGAVVNKPVLVSETVVKRPVQTPGAVVNKPVQVPEIIGGSVSTVSNSQPLVQIIVNVNGQQSSVQSVSPPVIALPVIEDIAQALPGIVTDAIQTLPASIEDSIQSLPGIVGGGIQTLPASIENSVQALPAVQNPNVRPVAAAENPAVWIPELNAPLIF